mmetsp:Transcript_21537/g.50209  ORF Transcript_21537/g.50209 Transcript_21537/m.50209 type:complete len:247 (-) Transcript_21537:136-876(-)|eukprot:CAMPEP_0178459726 /NCGR_PEP_ID=MMETSP0689_2-20121128/48296_1 /TAXON_ID=160604 /ORGANISM="Amphidinium massartii, Strain CS-259" /LENGTH=246 /DNA_ID=CAMNT_0020086247 /DNA_START=138 /DNA_END=878 /DNA_ORIENTATION=-
MLQRAALAHWVNACVLATTLLVTLNSADALAMDGLRWMEPNSLRQHATNPWDEAGVLSILQQNSSRTAADAEKDAAQSAAPAAAPGNADQATPEVERRVAPPQAESLAMLDTSAQQASLASSPVLASSEVTVQPVLDAATGEEFLPSRVDGAQIWSYRSPYMAQTSHTVMWAMLTTYIGLCLLAVTIFALWYEPFASLRNKSGQSPERSSQEIGFPPGYTTPAENQAEDCAERESEEFLYQLLLRH